MILMKKFLFTILVLSMISAAHSACEYGTELFNWTGRQPIGISQWGGPVTYGANITGFYVAMGRENIYLKFEIEEGEKVTENLLYSFRMNVNSHNVNYFDTSIRCNEITEFLEKPNVGATINWTSNTDWETIAENNFNISVQERSIGISFSLDFLGNPTEIHGFNMEIYSLTQKENDIWLQDSIDLCLLTGVTCGNEICEGGENDNQDICRYCPRDCPVFETCTLGETITDWSDASLLDTSGIDDFGGEEANGTDLVALKAKADEDNLYLKIDLDPEETPHENITYGIRLYPWTYDVEYIDIRVNCQGIHELVEKRGEFVSPTNYTSSPEWESIKNNFTVALTEHAVEVAVPWHVIYYPSGIGVNVWSFLGTDEMNHMSDNIESIISLFVSSCGDGNCAAEENDPSSRYQYCRQDCPDAQQPLCGNGVCDEGEDDRWNPLQCVGDCWEKYGETNGYTPPSGGDGDLFSLIIVLFILIGLITGISSVGRRIFRKVTAGRRKGRDLKKRLTQIDSEKKELQKKFMQTRISESEFKEQMSSLDREQQNIDLELKEKKK